jgi:hypothetical protein
MSYDSELECAVKAADAAGAMLREAFHNSRVSGHFADHSAEQQILETLSGRFSLLWLPRRGTWAR